jgi:hypothetical protein
VPRKEVSNWGRIGKVQPTPVLAWHTGLSGGAPDVSDAPGWLNVNWALSRKEKGDVAINHRTVRWAKGARGQRSAAQSAGDAWPTTTICWAHRTVRCANWSRRPTVGHTWYGRKSSTRLLQWLSGGALDCLVHHSIEGNNCLPNRCPTAPSYLGATKGTSRRMEQYIKHSLSILRHPYSASTHLICCVSDLSSVRVVNSMCCALSSSLGLCACVCCGLNLMCVDFPPLLLCFLWSILCKGERLQLVKIPRKREKISKERPWYSSWSSDHLKGVECNPRPLVRHNVEVGKCYLVKVPFAREHDLDVA